jgi:tetratricopeptide (TPR) repeat protein
MLLSSVLIVLATKPIESGIDLYESGLYEKSRAALSSALDANLPEAEQNRARLYLAADYFALGDRRGALYALEDLARQAPEQNVDTSVFPPEFITLWAQALARVTVERPVASPVTASPPPARAAPAQVAEAPLSLAAPEPRRSFKPLATIPAVAAIAVGAWGLFRYVQAQSLYGALTGATPPAALSEGRAIAAQGKAASFDAAIGTASFGVTAALAVALMLLL